jgi:DNA-directed RNA polymerase specialized sigma24 family protein
MPGPSGAPYGRTMLRRVGRHRDLKSRDQADLPWVYGAAIRAASGEETAARATMAAIGAHCAGSASGTRRRELMVAAVRSALADSPSEPLARLPHDEREAIGLVRILGLDVEETAGVLEREVREVKALLRAGLTKLATTQLEPVGA